MSRVGKKPIPLPKGVKITIGNEIAGGRPQGQAAVSRFRMASQVRQADGTSRFCAIPISAPPCTASRARWRPPPSRACPPDSRASSTSPAPAIAPTSRARSRRSRWAIRIPSRLLLPDGVDLKIDKQTHLVLAATTSKWWDRWRRTSARCVRPIRTRTRASATPAKCSARRPARPARSEERSKWRNLPRTTFVFGFTSASGIEAAAAARSGRVWPCSAA